MASEADNTPNPEQNLTLVEFASENQVHASYIQLESLYEQAQNPLFTRSLRGFKVSFDRDNGARYLFDYGDSSLGEYHGLNIQLRDGGIIALQQEHADVLEHGKVIGSRNITMNDQGEILASQQRITVSDHTGLNKRIGSVQGPSSNERYVGKAPAGYLSDLQHFIDKIWESPTSSMIGRIMSR